MIVSVFKTSVTYNSIDKVNYALENAQIVGSWNFDLEDCDNILRTESEGDVIKAVCKLLKSIKIECEELL